MMQTRYDPEDYRTWAAGDQPSMRLPLDPGNWTGHHLDRAEQRADRLFDRYEDRVDFSTEQTRSRTDPLYRSYQRAAQDCQIIATVVGGRTKHPV